MFGQYVTGYGTAHLPVAALSLVSPCYLLVWPRLWLWGDQDHHTSMTLTRNFVTFRLELFAWDLLFGDFSLGTSVWELQLGN